MVKVYDCQAMLPGNFTAVTAILLAIVPGFVATTVWARSRTWRGPSGDLRTVLESLAVSLVIQLLLAPLTIIWLYPVHTQLSKYPERVAIWLALAVIVLPICGGWIAARVTDALTQPESADITGARRRMIARLWPGSAPPSIWDWLFVANPPNGSFLEIEFLDGTRIAGVFAAGAMAITSPELKGVFLVEEWVVNEDGDITERLPGSRGIMVPDVSTVRWVRILGEEDDGETGKASSQGSRPGPRKDTARSSAQEEGQGGRV